MGQSLTLNKLFSNDMVLQRQKTVKVWGTYEGAADVEISLMGNTAKAAREGDNWTAMLPAMEAARNQTLLVSAGGEKIEIKNIHVGEVWLAGGQSNMEFYMRYDSDYREIVNQCENDDIRFFDVPEACYPEQIQDFDYSRMGFWRICNKKNLEYFSAAAYAFAARVWMELKIPVGIIGCNKGGSTTQSWMSEEYLAKHGQVWLDESAKEIRRIDYEAYKEQVRQNPEMNWGNPFADANNDKLLYGIGPEEQSKIFEEFSKLSVPPIHYDNRPACYYDNMLKKVAGAAIRGVIWYQGESEVYHVECYTGIFSDMIDCWRALWGEELPFYCVQLAPFQNWMDCYGTDFPELRQIQMEVAEKKQKVYLTSITDVGMRWDIHPKKKQPVGTRLALLALKHEYNIPLQAEAPKAAAVRAIKNDLHIEFQGDMDTLYVKGDKIQALQMFGSNMRVERELSFDPAYFAIEGKTLIIKNANMGGNRISRVVFAGTDYYEVNVYGSHHIPAMPFSLKVTSVPSGW